MKFLRIPHEVYSILGLLAFRSWPKWLWSALAVLPQALRARSLGVVDAKFGSSFEIVYKGRRVKFRNCDFGVVREIFGQECYCKFEELAGAKLIVDLGANCGVFSVFALLASSACLVSVEAQPKMIRWMVGNLELNGVRSRARVENALVGGPVDGWGRELLEKNPCIGIWDFRSSIPEGTEVDFLKVDVEGSEYLVFNPMPKWVRQIRRFALEYHGDWSDGEKLAAAFRQVGFAVTQRSHGVLGYLHGRRLEPMAQDYL